MSGADIPAAVLEPWTTSAELDKLAPDLVAALGELEEVTRGRTANAGPYSYSYADLGDVLAAVRPVFARHGLAISQVPVVDGATVDITTTIWHSSGQWLKSAPLRLPAGQTAQQAGSAITYARRYSVMALLGLGTEDDDGAGAAARPQPPALMSQSNLDRFRQAAGDAGLSPEDVAQVVETATDGRTDDVEQVWASEVPALRAALAEFTEPHEAPEGEAGDGREPISRPSPATLLEDQEEQ